MANYSSLKSAVTSVIKTNGNKEITGAVLQSTLLAIINSLGDGFLFKGVATPSTNPGTPDQNVFYIGGAGTYTNFNSLEVPTGYLGVLKYNGVWAVSTVQVGAVPVNDLTTGGTTVPLSAEMGKTLKTYHDENATAIQTVEGEVSQLRQEVPSIGNLSQTGVDLSIEDEDRNAIAIFFDGHLKTKKFDSSNVPATQNLSQTGVDLSIEDEDRNAIAIFFDGHLKTKKFDSSKWMNVTEKFNGKKVSILGDSISTFSGYLPNGYQSFYPAGDITNVNSTWWEIVVQTLGLDLLKNASWSGSRIAKLNGNSTSNAYCGASPARANDLCYGSVTPDIILVFIGMNDYGEAVGVGNYTGKEGIPTYVDNQSDFSIAFANMINNIRIVAPKARIFACTLYDRYNTNNDSFPNVNANNEVIADYNAAIITLSNTMGFDVCDLAKCGINWWNRAEYLIDRLHPNASGMQVIANKVISELISKY